MSGYHKFKCYRKYPKKEKRKRVKLELNKNAYIEDFL